MPSILVVDDHKIVRGVVVRMLESQDEWVCREAESGRQAIGKVDDTVPDVVLMDFDMPGQNGLDASKKILQKHPRARIAMVTAFPNVQLIREAKKVSLKGFCPKSNMHCIVEAVKALLKGGEYFEKSD